MYNHLTEIPANAIKDVPTIMLVGQPNTGKTTLFNRLTKSHFSTVNYPGSTVDFSTGMLDKTYGFKARLIDSPGILSLYPHSPDEMISINSLYNHPQFGRPDCVVLSADSTQLSRQIYLARQLRQSGFPVVMAITMNDLLKKRGLKLDIKKLSMLLSLPVVNIDYQDADTFNSLVTTLSETLSQNPNPQIHPFELPTQEDIQTLYHAAEEIEKSVIIPIASKTLDESLKPFTPQPDPLTLMLDRVLLHPVFGLFIFIIIMSGFFTSIFWLASPLMDWVDEGFAFLADLAVSTIPAGWISDLIASGVITGLGSVMVFVPQIMILFLIMTILEDSGYLARGAMLIDKPLSMVGLNGKSFVPLLSGFACAIPGMMAARTIPNKKERLLTIFILPLMSCSARLPVYALILSFLTPKDQPWIGGLSLAGLYMLGIFSGAIISAIADKYGSLKLNSSFILELPTYRLPKMDVIVSNTVKKTWSYVQKAGPTILTISLLLWALTYFPLEPEVDNLQNGPQTELTLSHHQSYAEMLGKFLEPVMQPMGFDWRVGVALISAFAAREVFVSALALSLNIDGSDEGIQDNLLDAMRSATVEDTGEPLFTIAKSIGLLIYFVFAMQCMATLAVAIKESGGWQIPLLQLVVFTLIGYVLAVLTVQGLSAMGIA